MTPQAAYPKSGPQRSSIANLGASGKKPAAGAAPKPKPPKISKVAAGYVYRPGCEYRCRECWIYDPARRLCLNFTKADPVGPNDYCTQWAKGDSIVPKQKPGEKGALVQIEPRGAFRPSEVGFGGLANGTKCARCVHFDGKSKCAVVDEDSPGDTPGKIHPDACCNSQSPRK